MLAHCVPFPAPGPPRTKTTVGCALLLFFTLDALPPIVVVTSFVKGVFVVVVVVSWSDDDDDDVVVVDIEDALMRSRWKKQSASRT